MWTPAEVMSRFVEAADVERRSPSKGMQQARTCWPSYRFDDEDRKGWTDDVQLEEQERWADTKGAKADAVSRYNEVVEWGITYLAAKETRRIVWLWAFCQVMPNRHFSTECKRKGWAKPTAYRRLTAACELISFNLNNDGVLLRKSRLSWVRRASPDMASISGTLTPEGHAASAVPNKPYRTEPSLDQPEIRDFSWAEQRSEREARRRQKLGLDAA